MTCAGNGPPDDGYTAQAVTFEGPDAEQVTDRRRVVSMVRSNEGCGFAELNPLMVKAAAHSPPPKLKVWPAARSSPSRAKFPNFVVSSSNDSRTVPMGP